MSQQFLMVLHEIVKSVLATLGAWCNQPLLKLLKQHPGYGMSFALTWTGGSAWLIQSGTKGHM